MYTQNYDIYTPVLHNERFQALKTNYRLGDITYNFDSNALRSNGLNALSFCFFVNWNNNYLSGTIDPHIWIKKGLAIHEKKRIDVQEPLLIEKFLSCEPLDAVINKSSFFGRYDLDLSYTIIWKAPLGTLPDNCNVIIELSYRDSGFQKNIINFGQLKNLLLQYSGRSIVMGKPLIYYETELEKILSLNRSGRTAPFPGDCDLLLYDNDFRCRAIIEFKKRTSRGANISIANQTISNYIEKDILKYRRLNLLRNYFEQKDESIIPLLNIFYSVAGDKDDNKIKIETISHGLQSGITDYFELPDFCDAKISHPIILQHILSVVDQYVT